MVQVEGRQSSDKNCANVRPRTLLLIVTVAMMVAAVVQLVPLMKESGDILEGWKVSEIAREKEGATGKKQTEDELAGADLTPLLSDAVVDPWKRTLYGRLDRIRAKCGAVCRINSVEELEKVTADSSGTMATVSVPHVDCPAILGLEEIDAGDTTFPLDIPDELMPFYTLSGAYPVTKYRKHFRQEYLESNARTKIWSKKRIDNLVAQAREGTLRGTYEIEGATYVRNVIKSNIDMSGKSVLVIGSETPWLEAICLSLGASKITTLEYGAITSQHPQIVTETPRSFRQKYIDAQLETFDGVLSHSSVEHSGLGRYGDALNPWGDILAVVRAWCTTKPGGFLYLGLPTGKDNIQYNAHRVYGKYRWPLVAMNWKHINTADTDGSELDSDSEFIFRYGGMGYVFEKME